MDEPKPTAEATTGHTLWLYVYNITGPRFDANSLYIMRAAWERSVWSRLGCVPVAVAVDVNAPEPKLPEGELPVWRLRLPVGLAAFVLEHELEW